MGTFKYDTAKYVKELDHLTETFCNSVENPPEIETFEDFYKYLDFLQGTLNELRNVMRNAEDDYKSLKNLVEDVHKIIHKIREEKKE